MDALLRKVLGAIAGVVICIAVWTLQDKLTGGGSESMNSIPTEVWGGGGGVVTIEAQASQPGNISVTFASDDPNADYLETWQDIPAGTTTFEIDVPANVSGEVWLRIDEPAVGATVHVAVKVDGRVVSESSDHLDAPLEAGYGFSVGIEMEDFARGRVAEAEAFFD